MLLIRHFTQDMLHKILNPNQNTAMKVVRYIGIPHTTRGEDSSTIYTYHLKVKDPCGIIVEQEIETEDETCRGDVSFDFILDCASRFWKRAHEEWEDWQSRN